LHLSAIIISKKEKVMGKMKHAIETALQIKELDHLVGGLGQEIEEHGIEITNINRKLDALRDLFSNVMKAIKKEDVCDCPDCRPKEKAIDPDFTESLLKRIEALTQENNLKAQAIEELQSALFNAAPPVMPKRTRRSPAQVKADEAAKAADKVEVKPEEEPEVKVQEPAPEVKPTAGKIKIGKPKVQDTGDEL
jgi:hypothetical protein